MTETCELARNTGSLNTEACPRMSVCDGADGADGDDGGFGDEGGDEGGGCF